MAKESRARSATADSPPEEEQAREFVYLGNRNGIEVVPDPDDADGVATIRRKIENGPDKRCTTVTLAPGLSLMEAAVQITDPARGVWQAHSDDDKPAWVASSNPALAQLLGSHWGVEVRDPEPEQAVPGAEEG